jgi:hypothetical protein
MANANLPVESTVSALISTGKEYLMPAMFLAFAIAIALRLLTYYTLRREEWFALEFDKRITKLLASSPSAIVFYASCKKALESTYYELFEVRSLMRRRKLDYVLAPSDRIFLIQHGSAFLVRDTLNELRHLKPGAKQDDILEVTKEVFERNPCFTRLFGVIPMGSLNDLLNIIPGLFIVGGIFGTFLGIMQALPELGNMDLGNPDSTKTVMDAFLLKTAFSMSTSAVGIMLSVTSTLLFSLLSPERVFMRAVNGYTRTLYRLWNRSHSFEIVAGDTAFPEPRDPLEALAERSVARELKEESPPARETTESVPPLSAAETEPEKKAS